MNKTIVTFCLGLLILGSGAGCTRGGSTTDQPQSTRTQSWVDAPLEGEQLSLAAYEIVTHTNVPSGVKAVELSINDAVVLTQPLDTSETLALVRHLWTPAAEGTYTIAVRGQDASGTWGEKTDVQVVVKNTVAAIVPPVSAAIIPDIPVEVVVPKVGPVFSEQTVSTDTIYYRGNGCGEMSVTMAVQAADAEGVASVALWYRLQDKSSDATTDWTELPMVQQSTRSVTATAWSVDLASDAIAGYTSYAEAWVEFYFTALDSDGTMSQSSTSTQDLTLLACHTNQTTPPVIIRTPPIKLPDIQIPPRQDIIK